MMAGVFGTTSGNQNYGNNGVCLGCKCFNYPVIWQRVLTVIGKYTGKNDRNEGPRSAGRGTQREKVMAKSLRVVPAYVVGFLYQHIGGDAWRVLLIRKNRPAWQAGALNGVGGHIEKEDRDSWTAMSREFEEETDVVIPASQWRQFCSLRVDNPDKEGEVQLYIFEHHTEENLPVKDKTDEPLTWVNVNDIRLYVTVDNLGWLVPMGIADYPVMMHGKELSL